MKLNKNWIGLAVLAAVAMVPAYGQSPKALEQIHSQARDAKTSSQHAAVAQKYRVHAENLAVKADEAEKSAAQMSRVAGATVQKWPGMATRQLQSEKAKAVEARRAAREAMELADRHVRLAVEAMAGSNTTVAGD